MDNKKNEKDLINLEHDQNNLPNDYTFLVQKLRSIRKIIGLLEKNF